MWRSHVLKEKTIIWKKCGLLFTPGQGVKKKLLMLSRKKMLLIIVHLI